MQLDTSRNLEEGKVKRKARPLVDLRLHKDFPFVLFDNRLDDRKAQAGPSEGARARLVGCSAPSLCARDFKRRLIPWRANGVCLFSAPG